MKITRVGIDLGKSVFDVHAVGRSGQVVVERRLTRRGLNRFIGELEPCLVGLEACGGAHYWARGHRGMGHDARLMSRQLVRPYVKSNKNDFRDAEAICEAVSRPSRRFVPVKSVEQQDLQHLHRVHSQAVAQRTVSANQRGVLLLEYGDVVARGLGHLRRRLPEVLEDADNTLSGSMRELLWERGEEMRPLDERVARFDARLDELSRATPTCQRWSASRASGPTVSTALVAAVGDASELGSGRELAVWVGVVPRQRSTGGRTVRLGSSKRGERCLRSLLIDGARAALRGASRRSDRRSRWALAVQRRRGANVATVAWADKTLRTVWAVLARERGRRRGEGGVAMRPLPSGAKKDTAPCSAAMSIACPPAPRASEGPRARGHRSVPRCVHAPRPARATPLGPIPGGNAPPTVARHRAQAMARQVGPTPPYPGQGQGLRGR